MSDIVLSYNEKDLFVYFQKIRLLAAKKKSGDNIERSKNVKEDKTTFKGVMNNVGHFFERSANGYDKKDKKIEKDLKDFEEKHPDVISDEEALNIIKLTFADDKYGLTRLIFASTIILDDEYDYKYEEDGLKAVSSILYGVEGVLIKIKKQLNDNYNAISPKSLSNVQKGILLGVAASSLLGLVTMPAILSVGAPAALAAHGIAGVTIFSTETILMSAALTGIAYGGMKLYNDIKVKQEFKNLSPEKNALYLALQCTYIERLKEQVEEDEFKEQLDNILKNLSVIKADLDYYLYVEKESTKENKAKVKSFHEFDTRLAKILGV